MGTTGWKRSVLVGSNRACKVARGSVGLAFRVNSVFRPAGFFQNDAEEGKANGDRTQAANAEVASRCLDEPHLPSEISQGL